MNEIVNRFLLEEDKRMPEMHFRQPGIHVVVDHLENKQRQNTKI